MRPNSPSLWELHKSDHGFANSLCLSVGLHPGIAVDVDIWMAPNKNLLHQGKDLMSKDLMKA
jgi:hypothetical protein